MRLVPLSADGRVTAVALTPTAPGRLRVVLEPDADGVGVVALGLGAPWPVGRLSGVDAAAYGPVLGQLGTHGLRGTCPARATDGGALVLELAPATGCVFGNSPDGLVLLAGERTVTVTREEHHQDVLAGRGGRVAVELRRCTIGAGKYAGQPGVEVALDGRRVGELTRLMSERYLPMIDAVAARGGRAGCEAVLRRDSRGIQVELRLPGADTTAVLPTAVMPPGPPRPAPPRTTVTPMRSGPGTPVGSTARVPAFFFPPRATTPPREASRTTVVAPPPMPTSVAPAPPSFPSPGPGHIEVPRSRGRRRAVWAGVAVVGVLLFASTVGNGTKNDTPAASVTAATASPSTSPAASAATSAPTTSPAPTAVPAAEPALAPAVAPTRRTATRAPAAPAAPRTTTPKPVAPNPPAPNPPAPKPPAPKPTTKSAPAPAGSGCDANYSGCVPIASDVDCEGGSGNGPAYVRGPVRVLDKDVYGLDSNKDGVACE